MMAANTKKKDPDKPEVVEGEVVDEHSEETTALATVPDEGGMLLARTPEEMKADIDAFQERRKVVVEYIDQNFIKGMDYGPTDPRCDKPTLKKPGAEKVCRLFNTRPTWQRDDDTWEMFGKEAGVVCYICRIVSNVSGKVIGEGRGAAKYKDKSRDHNKTVKNAEKCALVDAALYTFCLSEKFTQDMDLPPESEKPDKDPFAAKAPTRQERANPITQADVQPVADIYWPLAHRMWRMTDSDIGKPFKRWVQSIAGRDVDTYADWTAELVEQCKADLAKYHNPMPVDEREK